nr:MAG TPA: hypothetical protein [Caudoviricetes sp.]
MTCIIFAGIIILTGWGLTMDDSSCVYHFPPRRICQRTVPGLCAQLVERLLNIPQTQYSPGW